MSVSPLLQIHRDLLAAPAGPETDPRRKVYFEVFGCQMNKLDAELMVDVLLERGYSVTDRLQEAGVALFVTCSVRQHAEDRVLSKLGRLKSRKRQDPDFMIGVLGCMAQNIPEEIRRRHPYVDIICGTGEFLRLPDLIDEARSSGPVTAVDLEVDLTHARRRNLGASPFQAYVSVMRGCDQACTFCIVPRTRGKEISRPVVDVVEEVRALAAGGVREVTLLGQTVNSYGKRLAPGRQIGLHHLLHQLNKVPGLERIRFITSHPRFMSPDLIDAMGDLEKVCEYLHLPVQSGADSMLQRMLRTYTIDRYREVIARCREKIRGFSVATDFIVGFPGETDEEFEASCRLLEEIRFQGSFVFKYSPRPETRAAVLKDDVPDAVKEERNQRLLALQGELSLKSNRERIGRIEEVLVEGPSRLDPRKWTGRTRNHQIAVFPLPPGAALAGKLLPVRILDATALTLQGELVEDREGAPAPSPVAVFPLESIEVFEGATGSQP